jgi:hypothetical protein
MHHERTVTLPLRRCKRCCNTTQFITTAWPIVGKANGVAHIKWREQLLFVCYSRLPARARALSVLSLSLTYFSLSRARARALLHARTRPSRALEVCLPALSLRSVSLGWLAVTGLAGCCSREWACLHIRVRPRRCARLHHWPAVAEGQPCLKISRCSLQGIALHSSETA